jgi:hypothetical protein
VKVVKSLSWTILEEAVMNDVTATRGSSWKRRTMFNSLGIIVLILGLVGACFVYVVGQNRAATQGTNADGTWQDGSLAPADSKSFSHDVQMYNGTAGVLVVKWWEFCDALKQPGSVAIMIAAGSTVAACGFFMAAKRNNEA